MIFFALLDSKAVYVQFNVDLSYRLTRSAVLARVSTGTRTPVPGDQVFARAAVHTRHICTVVNVCQHKHVGIYARLKSV